MELYIDWWKEEGLKKDIADKFIAYMALCVLGICQSRKYQRLSTPLPEYHTFSILGFTGLLKGYSIWTSFMGISRLFNAWWLFWDCSLGAIKAF